MRNEWIEEKCENWVHGVDALASAARRYPQTAYAGLQKSLQQEWQFLQRVVKGIGELFEEVWKAISERFLPALFDDRLDQDDPRCKLACLPVKFAGLALPDPTKSADSVSYTHLTLPTIYSV